MNWLKRHSDEELVKELERRRKAKHKIKTKGPKPKRPSKPKQKYIEPQKMLRDMKIIYSGYDYAHFDTSEFEIPSEWKNKEVKFIFQTDCNGYYPEDGYIITVTAYVEYPDPDYDEKLSEFKKLNAAYDEKLKAYEEKYEQYKKDMKEWKK